MSAPIPAIPPLLHLKSRGLARVRLSGNKFLYLGRWGSEEARDNYAAVVADVLAGREPTKPQPGRSRPVSSFSVGELVAEFMRHADAYYRKSGRRTSQFAVAAAALEFMAPFAAIPVERISFADLKLAREKMLGATKLGPPDANGKRSSVPRLSRGTINRYCQLIVQAFRWAASESSAPAAAAVAAQSLAVLRPLQRDRCAAPERAPVTAVELSVVNATLPHLAPVVKAMVKLQLYSAARPGEICSLKVGDIDRGGDVWFARPAGHKTAHHGKRRSIAFGPKCIAILQPLLVGRDPAEHVFQPSKQPLVPVTERRFREASYRQAVGRACVRAGVECWRPNQLRHRAATELRSSYGIEAASQALGHSNLQTSLVYAESSEARLAEIAQAVG
jgi:integrase